MHIASTSPAQKGLRGETTNTFLENLIQRMFISSEFRISTSFLNIPSQLDQRCQCETNPNIDAEPRSVMLEGQEIRDRRYTYIMALDACLVNYTADAEQEVYVMTVFLCDNVNIDGKVADAIELCKF